MQLPQEDHINWSLSVGSNLGVNKVSSSHGVIQHRFYCQSHFPLQYAFITRQGILSCNCREKDKK